VVEEMHDILKAVLPLDDIQVCYHDDHDLCFCRKPNPGMLLSAANTWHVSLPESYMVGDRWKDVEAGRRAGCKTVLLRSSYNNDEARVAHYFADSIWDAASWILRQDASGKS
jgi:D-glycero-D-manno-heptose 1,7-bisphosphate phosphatase